MPVVGSPPAINVMSVVEEARRYLQGSSPGQLNVLGADIDNTVTTIRLEDPLDGLSRGSIIELGFEQMYVRSVDADAGEVTVIRGHGNTPKTGHVTGDLASISPSYHAYDLYNAVLDEFSALNGTGLVQHITCEFSYNGTDTLYDTGLDVESFTPLYVQEAKFEEAQTVSRWRQTRVELVKGLDVDDYESGFAFHVLDRPRSYPSGRYPSVSGLTLVRATVAATFARPSSTVSDISEQTLGINESVLPIVAVGAAWRMLLGKEAQRVNPDHSHGSRRAEEVPPGSLSFLGRALQGMKEDLIRSAYERQVAEYPPRQAL